MNCSTNVSKRRRSSMAARSAYFLRRDIPGVVRHFPDLVVVVLLAGGTLCDVSLPFHRPKRLMSDNAGAKHWVFQGVSGVYQHCCMDFKPFLDFEKIRHAPAFTFSDGTAARGPLARLRASRQCLDRS
ncbi:MAG: hypothetical protein U1F77_14940 [Kiritimatiellia bacterium]